MEQENSVFEPVIAKLLAERDEINALIDALQRRVSRADGVPFTPQARATDDTQIRHDSFFQMTIADAAKKYLVMVKTTKSTADIASALELGGLKHSSKDFPLTVRSILHQSGGFTRVPNGDWGLTEWYPGMGRGRKPKSDAKTPKLKTSPNKKKIKRREAVIQTMKTDPEKEWTTAEIAAVTGGLKHSVGNVLVKLSKDGKQVSKTQKGYRLVIATKQAA